MNSNPAQQPIRRYLVGHAYDPHAPWERRTIRKRLTFASLEDLAAYEARLNDDLDFCGSLLTDREMARYRRADARKRRRKRADA